MDEFQIRDGIDVKLHKYIPVAAEWPVEVQMLQR